MVTECLKSGCVHAQACGVSDVYQLHDGIHRQHARASAPVRIATDAGAPSSVSGTVSQVHGGVPRRRRLPGQELCV